MTECVKKKSFLCPFLSSTFCLFSVCCFDITFFCPLWLFRNQRERRDVFIHTHTRTEEERLLRELLQREREREKKKSMGKKEVRRFVSFRYNRKGRVKKTFALSEMMRSAHFFLTYSFRGGTLVLRG